MQPEVNDLIKLGYEVPREGTGIVSHDGIEAYEFTLSGRGVRDLRDAAMRIATFLLRRPQIARGYVLASLQRISSQRVRTEWNLVKEVLLPNIANRIRLLAVVDREQISEPPNLPRTPAINWFLERVATARPSPARPTSFSLTDDLPIASTLGTTWKHLEIEKVLMHRWLLKEPPIALGALSKEVGCSYPTTLKAVQRLSANGLIDRGRERSVGLSKYPRDRWADLLRTQRLVYPPVEFVDPTVERGAADGLIRRLGRLRPKAIAMGGVVAARHWDPLFDLNGTPRIDLVLHTPLALAPYGHGYFRSAVDFARHLDPALKQKSPNVHGPTVLVIHKTFRQAPLFSAAAPDSIPWASPVEVLCQLNDLGLTVQAGQMLRHLRSSIEP